MQVLYYYTLDPTATPVLMKTTANSISTSASLYDCSQGSAGLIVYYAGDQALQREFNIPYQSIYRCNPTLYQKSTLSAWPGVIDWSGGYAAIYSFSRDYAANALALPTSVFMSGNDDFLFGFQIGPPKLSKVQPATNSGTNWPTGKKRAEHEEEFLAAMTEYTGESTSRSLKLMSELIVIDPSLIRFVAPKMVMDREYLILLSTLRNALRERYSDEIFQNLIAGNYKLKQNYEELSTLPPELINPIDFDKNTTTTLPPPSTQPSLAPAFSAFELPRFYKDLSVQQKKTFDSFASDLKINPQVLFSIYQDRTRNSVPQRKPLATSDTDEEVRNFLRE